MAALDRYHCCFNHLSTPYQIFWHSWHRQASIIQQLIIFLVTFVITCNHAVCRVVLCWISLPPILFGGARLPTMAAIGFGSMMASLSMGGNPNVVANNNNNSSNGSPIAL